ncbi:hypothetical protein [Stenotrophomonas sp. NRRL B-14846]|uniref:thiolase family protein n=1 Tax=Stenotrophomonas sp. NRRL B-14846 TaxID=3162882 RepID=UPI003D2B62E6
MSNIVIAAAKRTAIASFLGQFNGVPTPTLGAAAIAAALEQSGVPASDVSEVLMGCVLPANLGQAPARQGGDRRRYSGVDRCHHPQQGVRLGHEDHHARP